MTDEPQRNLDDAAITAEGITKRFTLKGSNEGVLALQEMSVTVAAGEFVALLGPSGCGKTTMLRCIAGFETPTDGLISLRGERLNERPAHRRDVGLVFQNYALFPHLTVFENVAFGLRLRRTSKGEVHERVGRMLELVGLPDLAQRNPAQLSGGQQQRIAIAQFGAGGAQDLTFVIAHPPALDGHALTAQTQLGESLREGVLVARGVRPGDGARHQTMPREERLFQLRRDGQRFALPRQKPDQRALQQEMHAAA